MRVHLGRPDLPAVCSGAGASVRQVVRQVGGRMIECRLERVPNLGFGLDIAAKRDVIDEAMLG